MKKILAVMFVIAFASSGCGGGGDVTWTRSPGSINGTVSVETLTLEPGDPGNIRVYLKESPGQSATTTSMGTFSISSVPPGTYTVRMETPDPPTDAVYDFVRPAGGEWENVRVLSGIESINVDFHLEAIPAPPDL